MKRRRFFTSLVAVPAASALLGQQSPPPQTQPQPAGSPVNAALPVQPPARAAEELPKLEPSVPDAAAEMKPRFFTTAQFSALSRLADLMAPPINGAPGASDAHAAEFLDFLIGESPAERQEVYQKGLDALNAQAKKTSGKPFSETDDAQAALILAPLRQPWTYETPTDPIARFLRVAKLDVRTATQNSREYAAVAASGARRVGGGGIYWYPLD